MPLYLSELLDSQIIEKRAFLIAVNKIIKVASDLITDLPIFDDLFSKILIFFLNKGVFKLADLVWLEENIVEGEEPMVETSYFIMARILDF